MSGTLKKVLKRGSVSNKFRHGKKFWKGFFTQNSTLFDSCHSKHFWHSTATSTNTHFWNVKKPPNFQICMRVWLHVLCVFIHTKKSWLLSVRENARPILIALASKYFLCSCSNICVKISEIFRSIWKLSDQIEKIQIFRFQFEFRFNLKCSDSDQINFKSIWTESENFRSSFFSFRSDKSDLSRTLIQPPLFWKFWCFFHIFSCCKCVFYTLSCMHKKCVKYTLLKSFYTQCVKYTLKKARDAKV